MKIFGIAGHSGMGKTTLLERLLPLLRARGMVVSLIKHSHKSIQIDQPGKDSHRLREAGCQEVLLLGNERWALMHELRGAAEPPLEDLLARLARCAWWPGIVGVASDAPTQVPPGVHALALDDIGPIADLMLAQARGPLAQK